ncbi:MAG: hypothetical protein WKF83_15165 [Nocardioidaceae bacterium]
MVLHVLRSVRSAVPGRHRARRPHHGHAPLPGAGRVELPGRAERSCSRAWRTRATRGTCPPPRGWTGPRTWTFEVKQVGGGGQDDLEDLTEVDWLFWVGCAGAYEDRAKKTTRAVAELLAHGRRRLRRAR